MGNSRTFKLLSVILLLAGLSQPLQAQIFEPDGLRMPGSWNGFANFNGMGGDFDLSLETTGTRRWTTQFQYTGATGNQDFKFVSGGGDPWFNQWAATAHSVDALTTGIPFCGGCGPANNTITVTNGMWYSVNWLDNGYTTTDAIFMATSAQPVTIDAVSSTPLGTGGTVALTDQDVTVTVTTSAIPSAEEKIYLRYSTDGFASSSLAEVTGFAAIPVGTAVIPGQADGTSVSYYIFSTTLSSPASNFDMLTINFNNNSGANYNYTVSNPVATTVGNWNAAGTWNTGQVPVAGAGVTINAAVTLDVDAQVSSLTIDGSGSLDNSSQDLRISSGGTLTNNGGFTGSTGSVTFDGAGTVNGTITFNDVNANGLINFGSGSTISGEFTLLTGGGINTNRPSYGASSTLVYNTGSGYFTNIEWEGTTPANVRVTGSTLLTIDNTFTFECSGDLTIDGSSSITVDNSAQDVGVFGDFSIAAGSSMTLSGESGDDLFVRGDFTNNGTFNSNNRAVVFDLGGIQTIAGSTTIDFVVVDKSGGSLSLNSGATLNIKQGLTASNGTFTTTGGTLTLLSDASTTAWLDDFSGSGSISGSLTQQRYVAGVGSDFHFLTAPLGGATINGDLSEIGPSGSGQIVPLPTCSPTETDPAGPYGSVMEWNEAGPFTVPGCDQSGWYVVSSGAMTPGKSYACVIPSGTTMDIAGTTPASSVSYGPLSNTTVEGDGWQMVGNPFPSPIEWDGVAGFDAQAQLWQTSGTYTGTFQSILAETGGTIGSMQGFQVRVTSGSATFTLTNSDRTTGNPTFYRTESWFDQLVQLDVTGNGFADKSVIYFADGGTADWDSQYDANKKYSAAGQPTIYTMAGVEMAGINGQGKLDGPKSIDLGFRPGADGTFTISATELNGFEPSALIFLEDLAMGLMTNLTIDGDYTFNMLENDAEMRFRLHVIPPVEVAVADAGCENNDGEISIDLGSFDLGSTTMNWDSYSVTNSVGTLVASGTTPSSEVLVSGLEADHYELEVNLGMFSSVSGVDVWNATPSFAGFELGTEEVYAGYPVQLLDNSANAASHAWDFGDGNVSFDASPTHIWNTAGLYEVRQQVWSEDGCVSENVSNVEVTIRSTGIEDEMPADWTYYSSDLNIFANGADISAGNTATLTDLLGRTIGATTCESGQCMITAPAPGFYLLTVESNAGSFTHKVLLQY